MDTKNMCQGFTQHNTPCQSGAKYDNKYCKKHSKFIVTENDELLGIKRCSAGVRCVKRSNGIGAIIPSDSTCKQCVDCRYKGREKDSSSSLRKEIIEYNALAAKNSSENRKCYECPKDNNEKHVSEMGKSSNGIISNKCSEHFNKQQIIDKNRVRDPVKEKERSKKLEAKPQRKKAKKEYRKNNRDKSFKSCTKYRAKKLSSDPVGFRKRNAETHMEYVKKHPDITKHNTYIRKTQPKRAYGVHKRRCKHDNIDNNISLEQFEILVKQPCYYCDKLHNEYLNGIDRTNNDKGYDIDNCVPCCQQCNYMKNTLNKETFILMCVHIVTYLCLGDYGFFPEVFDNTINKIYFSNYEYRANKKGIDFTLSQNEFDNIVNNDCCFCGKKTNNNHYNGIDRIDSNKGYVIDNCKPCCKNCNFLKRKYECFSFVFRCVLVAQNHADNLYEIRENWIPSNQLRKNIHKQRLSKNEKFLEQQATKLTRHEKTMKTKTPEFINQRAEEIRIAGLEAEEIRIAGLEARVNINCNETNTYSPKEIIGLDFDN